MLNVVKIVVSHTKVCSDDFPLYFSLEQEYTGTREYYIVFVTSLDPTNIRTSPLVVGSVTLD